MTRSTTPPRRKIDDRRIPDPEPTGQPAVAPTFFHDGVKSVTVSRWACLAGWKRAGLVIATPPAAVAAGLSAHQDPTLWANSTGAVASILAVRTAQGAVRRVKGRRFRSVYLRPLTQVVREQAKIPGATVRISPDMSGLAARLIRPMSPAELAARDLYGRRLQPIVMWLPEQGTRGRWWLRDHTEPVRKAVDWFRISEDIQPPRVEIRVPSPGFVTKDQRDLIRQAVVAKLGLTDLVESWDQVGPAAVGTWTVRERPPEKVRMADLLRHLEGLPEHEFVVGLTTGSRPVIISLDDDAPHFACSAGSGAGKSVLAKLLAMQVLAKGGHVTIIDRKGSHRWARGLDGVTYCTKPAEMHAELIRLSGIADQRNDQALLEDDGWDPGQREFVIFEEMNATVPQLRQWWEDNREKGDPKASPAVSAFRNVMFMGRSAKMNLFGVAQMLTANTTGGPEARENFGVRALARYTANNWKMLAPECPMPRKSKTRGRWQFVIAGEATEVQVGFVTDAELWAYLDSVPASPRPQTAAGQQESTGTPEHGDNRITLQQAAQRYCPGISIDTLKKRRTRARRTGGGPQTRGQRGRTELYDADEFVQWLTAESLISTESDNVPA